MGYSEIEKEGRKRSVPDKVLVFNVDEVLGFEDGVDHGGVDGALGGVASLTTPFG